MRLPATILRPVAKVRPADYPREENPGRPGGTSRLGHSPRGGEVDENSFGCRPGDLSRTGAGPRRCLRRRLAAGARAVDDTLGRGREARPGPPRVSAAPARPRGVDQPE